MNLMEKYIARAKQETVTKEAPVRPLRYAVKLYSPILGGYLWVVQDSNDWPGLKENGEPVYDAQEIRELQGKGLNSGELRAVHEVKKSFTGSRIDNEHNN